MWLKSNPYSVESCITNGKRLQWRLQQQAYKNSTVGSKHNDLKRQKIATNSHLLPRTCDKRGLVNFNQLCFSTFNKYFCFIHNILDEFTSYRFYIKSVL